MRRGDPGRRRARALAIALATASLLMLAVTVAQAQDVPDPYATSEQQVEDTRDATGQDLDTDITPKAKEGDFWNQVAGVPYGETEPIESPAPYGASDAIPFDVSLYDVSFRNPRLGFAGGASCRDPESGEVPEPGTEQVGQCTPVLYRFARPQAKDPVWQRVDLPGAENAGYVGQIAWIDSDTALAVGGDGVYPRRELPRTDENGRVLTYEEWVEQDLGEGAGRGRAWLYDGGRWRELGLSAQLADGMRGMTALDCHAALELCIAGGLGQLWHWEDGSFTIKVDRDSPDLNHVTPGEIPMKDARQFLYRVREIRFMKVEKPNVVAVTAGCCAEAPALNTPRLLVFHESSGTGVGSDVTEWRVSALGDDFTGSADTYSGGGRPLGQAGPAVPAYRQVNRHPTVPDSLYSVTGYGFPSLSIRTAISVLATPGGPERPGEPPAMVTQRYCSDGGVARVADILAEPATEVARTSLSTARLVAADGDAAKSAPLASDWRRTSAAPSTFTSNVANACVELNSMPGDAIPDWSVGELRSTRADGLGARGLAMATHLRPTLEGEAIGVEFEHNPGGLTLPVPQGVRRPTPVELLEGYEPTSAEKLQSYVAARYFLLPSYSVNALDVDDSTGTGWAVGDHGAVLKLADVKLGGGGTMEPEPPRLGAKRPRGLSDGSPYDGVRPASAVGQPGRVPPLTARPSEQLEGPELVPAGAPDPTRPQEQVEDVRQIVISRDGSEGWAIGPSAESQQGLDANSVASLYRYEGGAWSRCDPLGVAGQLPADPACEGVAGLRRFLTDGIGGNKVPASVRLLAAARVPLERDSDPANDDEFEVVAVGTKYREDPSAPELPAVIRYRDGRWDLERPAERAAIASTPELTWSNVRGLAFAAPDDGWLLVANNAGSARKLYHYDGERWRDCAQDLAACGDSPANPRIPLAAGSGTELKGLVAAGERVYLYGTRAVATSDVTYPMIVYRERGGRWTDGGGKGEDRSGYDPGFGRALSGGEGIASDPESGTLDSVAVAQRPDGAYEGWAVGAFGRSIRVSAAGVARPQVGDATHAMLRLAPSEGWRPFDDSGAAADYVSAAPDPVGAAESARPRAGAQLLVLPEAGSEPLSLLTFVRSSGGIGSLILAFNRDRGRWELLPGARPPLTGGRTEMQGTVQAIAPDNRGGAWVATRAAVGWIYPPARSYFFHLTDVPPEPVFEDAPHPLDEPGVRLTALAGAPDGSLWASTDSELLARYDRLTGWEAVAIPGWDPGRLITRPSRAYAVALGPDGSGVAVGEEGRIADLTPREVSLDAAAGTVCEAGAPSAPCGTARDLTAVAVAPDGSAIAGGERLALLWRPASGEFRGIARPEGVASATVTGASMPSPERAYLTTDSGALYAGEMTSPGSWSWELENETPAGDVLGLDSVGNSLALRAISVDGEGHGYAVGDQGLILERAGDGQAAWRRLRTPFLDDLTSVTLPAGGGGGALIGGRHGVVLTADGGSVALARPADFSLGLPPGVNENEGATTGPVVGLALLPGLAPGQLEAWAAIQGIGPGTNRMLHYSSHPGEPLLAGGASAVPLPDTPVPQVGELSFAVFGKSDCHLLARFACGEMSGSTAINEAIASRVNEEIATHASSPGGPELAIFTGDAVDSSNFQLAGTQAAEAAAPVRAGLRATIKHRRWLELYADPLRSEGVPLFGAIGSQDLSEQCLLYNPEPACERSSKNEAKVGDNVAWRQTMAAQPAPWGDAEPAASGSLSFEPIGDSEDAIRIEDPGVEDPDGPDGPLRAPRTPFGGATTHYAVDVIRGEQAVARLVFLDSSLRSLAAGDPLQNPVESDGGQLGWLERMVCFAGETTSTGEPCTREPDQQAIVVSNTPTYSYGPGLLTETATDASALEAHLIRYRVNLLVSGRLGWNGRYWATAPGVHVPCPGEDYLADDRAPAPGTLSCEGQDPSAEAPAAEIPSPAVGDPTGAATGLLPVVVASGAGGKFGPSGDATGSASEGFWHGYTIVRLAADGDPRMTVVEQRPIYDWVGVEGTDRVLGAREEMTLEGFGRGPIATAITGVQTARFDAIDSPAVTHRYDLLLADPEEPWVPCLAADESCRLLRERLGGSRSFDSAGASGTGSAQDDRGGACEPYLCLPERVGRVDSQTGEVEAGNGKYPDTYAIAMLSVGEHVATYPLMFAKSPSFVVQPLRLAAPAPGPPPSVPSAPNAPSPPPVPKPNVPQPSLPELPALPGVPPLAAAQPPEPQPPAPPAPPPPTEQPSPLDLTVSPTALTVATPAAVIQPPTPPVNPAPPGGARREARQRQAATQKSGADSVEEGQDMGVDIVEGPLSPTGAAMTRREPGAGHQHAFTRHAAATTARGSNNGRISPVIRPARGEWAREPSFTPLTRADQPSAWAQGALYSGGMALVAFALAAGWSRSRPTPRQRPPEVPAPAFARARIRRW